MTRSFVAPGKVVLLGEYAVLDGAPAIVCAVDSGVRVTATSGPPSLTTPTGDDRFARAALAAVGAPPAAYTFSAWNPPGTHAKPGLGGSAAAVVAGCLAGLALQGPVDRDRLCRAALQAHRETQGSGSGIDVRAAVHGGVLRIEGTRVTRLPPVAPVVVYSGTSARTGPRVARYLAWSDRRRFVEETRRIVDRFAADPVGALRANAALLEAMADAAGLDYLTDGLAGIARLAAACGGAAKPSGAGGGDVAVALFPDAAAAAAFRDACARAGYDVLDVAVTGGAHEVPP